MIEYKVVLYGDHGVGKTSLTTRLLKREFNNWSPTTIGASYTCWKPNQFQGAIFGLWDTAGQERFTTIIPMYLRNAHAVFYCWDYNIPFDFHKAGVRINEARALSANCIIFLVFTKIDLKPPDTRLEIATVHDWAQDNNVNVVYTSSQTGAGVAELFISCGNKLQNLKDLQPLPDPEIINLKPTPTESRCGTIC